MSSSALAQALKEYQQLQSPIPRDHLKEMAKALPHKDCRTDKEFRKRLTTRQREIFDEAPQGGLGQLVRDRSEGRTLQERVREVIGMQVDVSAKFQAVCNDYKEMLDKIKIYELDVMLEDRHTEEMRLESLDVKYTINETLAKMVVPQLQQEP